MKLLVSVAPQALWQTKQAQFELDAVSLAELTATDSTALESGTTLARLLNDSVNLLQLNALLNQYPQAEVMLAYAAPEQQLGMQLAQGETPEQVASNWCQQVQALLQLQQQQRRRLKLFCLSYSAANPVQLPVWLQYQSDKHQSCPADTVYSVLAAQLLRQNSNCASLLPRLQASSLPTVATEQYQFDLAALQQQAADTSELDAANRQNNELNLQLRQLTAQFNHSCAQQEQLQQQLDKASSQLAASNDERDLLLQQLLHVQEELEQLFQKKQIVEQQHSKLEQDYRAEVANLSEKLQHGTQTVEKTASQLQGLQDEIQRITEAHNQLQQQYLQATAQLSASNDERDLLLQQLLHVQEELEQLFQKKQIVKQQHSKLEPDYRTEVASLSEKLQHGAQTVEKTASQLHSLQDELQRITNAHNESQQQIRQLTEQQQKLQQQLQDQATQLQKQGAELNNVNVERDLLLQQLLHVQEDLELYYLKWQQGEQKASQANTARDKQQQRELSKLESQLRKSKARAASAEHLVQLLQQELGAVKGSTVWKTAAPVRALTRLIKKPDPAKQKLQQEAALIITSEYFDIDWYLQRYPDVAEGKINPAEHYLRFGASEGRMPGPLFDGDWYLQRYPDVAQSGINPLLHFIKFGQLEGRSASPKLLADNSMRED